MSDHIFSSQAQAAEAQAAAAQASESAAPGPPPAQPQVEADGPWQDMRYATLEEVKAELVRARGQVFKIQHDPWLRMENDEKNGSSMAFLV